MGLLVSILNLPLWLGVGWGFGSLYHLQGRLQSLKPSQMCLMLISLWARKGPESHGVRAGGHSVGISSGEFGVAQSQARTWHDLPQEHELTFCHMHVFLVPIIRHAWTEVSKQGYFLQERNDHLWRRTAEPFTVTLAQPWSCHGSSNPGFG